MYCEHVRNWKSQSQQGPAEAEPPHIAGLISISSYWAFPLWKVLGDGGQSCSNLLACAAESWSNLEAAQMLREVLSRILLANNVLFASPLNFRPATCKRRQMVRLKSCCFERVTEVCRSMEVLWVNALMRMIYVRSCFDSP